MPNDINKPTTDHLSEAFRTKLENHQMPVDASMWGAIESKLAAQNKNKKWISPIWWASTAIAAAVALLFIFNIPSVIDQPNQIAQQINSPIQNTQNTAIQTNKANADVLKNVNSNRKVSSKTTNSEAISSSNNTKQKSVTSKQNTSPATVDKNKKSTSKTYFELIEESKLEANIDKLASTEKPTVNQSSADTITNIKLTTDQLEQPNKNNNTPKLELKTNDWTDPIAKKQSKKGIELIAMAGSSGNSRSGIGSNNSVFSDLNDVSYFNYVNPEQGPLAIPSAKEQILPLNSYNDQNHLAPISAGVAISFGLTDKLSIETGLNYNYLQSTFQNTSTNSDARSHLHYLGIPLRISYQYAQAPKWQFYISGGTMLEKGLWQLFVQNQHYTNQVYTTRVKNNIEGVQWSLQASTGVGYTLFKNTSFYFEPKVAWYFDNNQPTSIRTENKLSIGFEAGLRFNIN